MTNIFPIDELLPEICSTLARNNALVIQAPPGAGKTTQVPPALLNAPWLGKKKILMLEPRRVAARAAAGYMASRMGERVGELVGYQIRMERKISAGTRIEVVTEGILTARLQSDPSLEDIGVVIFDEFHERNLNSDLGLALSHEIQEVLRDDLKLVVMSATLDPEPVAALLNNAPILISKGKSWPVTTHYVDPGTFGRPGGKGGYLPGHIQETRALEAACVWAIKDALTREQGDILVFIPGMREIKNMEKRIRTGLSDILTPSMELLPLHGSLPRRDQDKAILKHPRGHRKIVLATAIAETSITMEGVNIVIDMGLMRISRFYPGRGMDRLETVTAPLSSVDQRRGRAGRTGPGICYRLWSRESHAHRPPFPAPEIIQADLADLVLQLALWGVQNPSALKWLDLPPGSTFNQARDLLISLGAIDKALTITRHGKKLARLGIHPRLGHMICRGKDVDHGVLACHMAALLQDRDIINFTRGTGDADITLRLEILYAGVDRDASKNQHGLSYEQSLEKNGMIINTRAVDQVRRTARQLALRAGIEKANFYDDRVDFAVAGTLLSFAFPERIAMARPGQRGFFLMASGSGARINPRDPLAGESFIVAAQLDGQGNNAMVFLGAPHDGLLVENDFPENIVEQDIISWDPNTKSVKARRQRRYGSLLLSTSVLKKPDASRVALAMMEGIRSEGLFLLPWTKTLRTWQARVCFLVSTGNYPDLPPINDTFLMDSLESWLLPFLEGISCVSGFKHLDLSTILESRFTWSQLQRIQEHAPTHITVPSGSRIPLVYGEAVALPLPAHPPICTQETDKNKKPVNGDKISGGRHTQAPEKLNAMEAPVLPVRLQEMFGCTETPTIAGGRVPVILHLLSPAGRPVQITRDLTSFWENTYVDVKKDLMGRYPRHYWPDNPLNAQPTRRAKPKARTGK
ncbi:ATP-dependent helicase HrpB [Desulfocicer niacini]